MKRVTTKSTKETEKPEGEPVERLLTESEVAARQGRAEKTLRNQRVNGDGIPYLKLGRIIRYRLADVLAWEDARRHCSTSDLGGNR